MTPERLAAMEAEKAREEADGRRARRGDPVAGRRFQRA